MKAPRGGFMFWESFDARFALSVAVRSQAIGATISTGISAC
jgi:hypothetical protein